MRSCSKLIGYDPTLFSFFRLLNSYFFFSWIFFFLLFHFLVLFICFILYCLCVSFPEFVRKKIIWFFLLSLMSYHTTRLPLQPLAVAVESYGQCTKLQLDGGSWFCQVHLGFFSFIFTLEYNA